MTYDIESVYALLPAYVRTRDERLGQQLRAESDDADAASRSALDYAPLHGLVSLFAHELQTLHEGTEQMYDDLFIETCAEWVIPYIGELVGVRLPPDALRGELNPRALVADAIADRRRKGTIGGLERVADAAVASWLAKATEYWKLLIQSQNLNHLRQGNIGSLRITDLGSDHLIDTAFDTSARSVDARSASGRWALQHFEHRHRHMAYDQSASASRSSFSP